MLQFRGQIGFYYIDQENWFLPEFKEETINAPDFLQSLGDKFAAIPAQCTRVHLSHRSYLFNSSRAEGLKQALVRLPKHVTEVVFDQSFDSEELDEKAIRTILSGLPPHIKSVSMMSNNLSRLIRDGNRDRLYTALSGLSCDVEMQLQGNGLGTGETKEQPCLITTKFKGYEVIPARFYSKITQSSLDPNTNNFESVNQEAKKLMARLENIEKNAKSCAEAESNILSVVDLARKLLTAIKELYNDNQDDMILEYYRQVISALNRCLTPDDAYDCGRLQQLYHSIPTEELRKDDLEHLIKLSSSICLNSHVISQEYRQYAPLPQYQPGDRRWGVVTGLFGALVALISAIIAKATFGVSEVLSVATGGSGVLYGARKVYQGIVLFHHGARRAPTTEIKNIYNKLTTPAAASRDDKHPRDRSNAACLITRRL